MTEDKVLCTNCNTVFHENEIVYDEGLDVEFCPYCAVANHTMDLMTRAEMLEFIKENPNIPVSHTLFDSHEYIYCNEKDGNVYDENGYLFEDWDSVTNMWSGVNGLRLRQGGRWDNEWFIWDNKTN